MTTRVVLAGAGHAHLAVLEQLAGVGQRLQLDVLLITPSPVTLYSGMMPGWMAGHYALAEAQIAVAALAERAGIRVLLDTVVGLDAARKVLVTRAGERIPYDILSLNTGGEPEMAAFCALGHRAVGIRPLDAFSQRWSQFVREAAARRRAELAVVGAGAAGVELAMAAHDAMRRVLAADARPFVAGHPPQGKKAPAPGAVIHLVDPAPVLHRGLARGAARRVARALGQRGIVMHNATAEGSPDGLVLRNVQVLAVDLAIIATESRAPAWVRSSGLQLGPDGHVAVGADHRSVSHDNVFAAGDVCCRVDRAVARSGVHAVKAGPVLARNLLAAIEGTRPVPYKPRSRTLYLLALGDRRAVMSWGGISAEGQWVWRWKRAIDRRFVRARSGESSSQPGPV